MTDLQKKNQKKEIEQLAKEARARGCDLEIRSSKVGIKVYEVSKRLLKEIPIEQLAER